MNALEIILGGIATLFVVGLICSLPDIIRLIVIMLGGRDRG